MPRLRRLDVELVRRGLARSREQAAELVAGGRVSVAGRVAVKPATGVETGAPITVTPAAGSGAVPGFVSRGGQKLSGALAEFALRSRGVGSRGVGSRGVGSLEVGGLAVAGRRCLDAGASTGGFTDALLRAGAAQVVAVDVGYGQLAWSLRTDPRVTVVDRTNVRNLTLEQVGAPADVVVADLSFISLRLVLGALQHCAVPDADFVILVKPQFEVGRDHVGPGGVVRDPALRADAVQQVAGSAARLGLGVLGVTASRLPGRSGNVEYFLWLRAGAPPLDPAELDRAIHESPQPP